MRLAALLAESVDSLDARATTADWYEGAGDQGAAFWRAPSLAGFLYGDGSGDGDGDGSGSGYGSGSGDGDLTNKETSVVSISSIEQDIGEWVVVRTYSAGIHYGRLFRRDGKEAILTAAKRIWSWNGANTLHEVATIGPDSGRISKELPWILLTEAIEFLPLGERARKKLDEIAWQ